MKGDPNAAPDKVKARIEPIMTNSESITQFGNNAYGKPATALNILRETVLGREHFDYNSGDEWLTACQEADLLIMDDLGTEYITPLTISVL